MSEYNTIPVGKLSPELEKIAKAIQADIEKRISKTAVEGENENDLNDKKSSNRSGKSKRR